MKSLKILYYFYIAFNDFVLDAEILIEKKIIPINSINKDLAN